MDELREAAAVAAITGNNSPMEYLGRLTELLSELPADSVLGKHLGEFLPTLIENYKDGPGAPGRNAYAIICAAADSNDSAYKSISVQERAMVVSAANALKGLFR